MGVRLHQRRGGAASGGEAGQMTVELAAAFPVLIAVGRWWP